MSTKTCTHTDHEHGGYAPGPVYQASIFLPDGTIFTSSPGTGEDFNKALKAIRKATDEGHFPRGTGTKLQYVGPTAARTALVDASERWRTAAVNIETHLVSRHKGFKAKSADCLALADKLASAAKVLTS
jgi:hypothetical protein